MEIQSSRLVSLDNLSADVVSQAQRSIRLLEAIENTISALCYDRSSFGAMASFAHELAEHIKIAKRKALIDQDSKRDDQLFAGQKVIRNLYNVMAEKKRAAELDPDLLEEDGVVEEYGKTLPVIADLYNGLNELRLAVGEYDADLSKGEGPALEKDEEIEKYLRAI